MTQKRSVKQTIRRLERIKTWQLVVLLLIIGLLAATFLRLNNIGMVERRAAILSADEAGDTVSLKNNLYALQRYSAVHMNAESGPIYLQGEYSRQVQQIVTNAQKNQDNSVNEQALAQADAVCRQQFPGYSQAYVQCNASEQAKYQGQTSINDTLKFPNPNLYRHQFISPVWSPDFAGLTLVLCGLISLVIILRLTALAILKLLLRRHYSSI